MKQVKRTFVGIGIPGGKILRQDLGAIKNFLGEEKIKWTAPANFHITLHFFGDTVEKDIRTISRILDETVRGRLPVHFRVAGAGIFRNVNHPRVLWLGLENLEQINDLRDDFESRLVKEGLQADDKPFRPHLTLGRMKRISDRENFISVLERYRDKIFTEVTAGEVIYFESILTERGSVYKAISKHGNGSS